MVKIILIHHYFEFSKYIHMLGYEKINERLFFVTLNVRNKIVPRSGDNSIAFKI